MIQLRDYQEELLDGARSAFRSGQTAVLLQLPTGGGKTLTSAFMVKRSSEKGLTCWWLVHRREIIAQASSTFSSLGIAHGLIMAGACTDPHKRAQVGSIQTIVRRMDGLPAPDIIFFDEAHHMASGQYQQVFDAYPRAKKVGMTATPWRLDGKGLGRWFQSMVEGPSVATLIERGSLSRYRLFAPSNIDTSAIKIQAGDFKRDDLSALMDKPSITGDAVEHYLRLARGKRAVAFACSIEHSQHIVAQFQANGVPAEHVDGGMDVSSRDGAIQRFVAGETLVLSNCELFGEGFDVPAIEAAILLRPTKSLSLHLQQVGRALRPSPGKAEAIILDHAGNTNTHGLPDDERGWTLDDRAKKKAGDKAGLAMRTCSECFRVYRPAPKCPGCGHVHEVQAREIETRDGVLAEVDPTVLRAQRKQEERRAQSIEDLIRLGQSRGYKNPRVWAEKFFHARNAARSRYQPARRWA